MNTLQDVIDSIVPQPAVLRASQQRPARPMPRQLRPAAVRAADANSDVAAQARQQIAREETLADVMDQISARGAAQAPPMAAVPSPSQRVPYVAAQALQGPLEMTGLPSGYRAAQQMGRILNAPPADAVNMDYPYGDVINAGLGALALAEGGAGRRVPAPAAAADSIMPPEEFLGRPLTPDHIWNDPRFSHRMALTNGLDSSRLPSGQPIWTPAQRFDVAGEQLGQEIPDRIRWQRAMDGTDVSATPSNTVSMGELIDAGRDPQLAQGLPEALNDYLGEYRVGGPRENYTLLGTPDPSADPMLTRRGVGFGSPPRGPRLMPNEDRRWPMFGTRGPELPTQTTETYPSEGSIENLRDRALLGTGNPLATPLLDFLNAGGEIGAIRPGGGSGYSLANHADIRAAASYSASLANGGKLQLDISPSGEVAWDISGAKLDTRGRAAQANGALRQVTRWLEQDAQQHAPIHYTFSANSPGLERIYTKIAAAAERFGYRASHEDGNFILERTARSLGYGEVTSSARPPGSGFPSNFIPFDENLPPGVRPGRQFRRTAATSADLREATQASRSGGNEQWIDLYRGSSSEPGAWRGSTWATPSRRAANDYAMEGMRNSASEGGAPNVRPLRGNVSGAVTISSDADLYKALGPDAHLIDPIDGIPRLRRVSSEHFWELLDAPEVQDALRRRGVNVIRVPNDSAHTVGIGHESYLFLNEDRIRSRFASNPQLPPRRTPRTRP